MDKDNSPKARVSFAAGYFDAINRTTKQVDVGTNGGSAWIRPATANDPSLVRSDDMLISDLAYNAAGWLDMITDPRAINQKHSYDNLGRQTQLINAYTNGVPTNNTNRKTESTFDGNDHLVGLKAVLPDDPPGTPRFQTTQWVYGVGTANGSLLNSNDLLREIRYPDKDTGNPSNPNDPNGLANIESLKYNAVSQVKSRTDRNQTVHDYTFDVVSRMTADAVTLAIGNPHNVDGFVKRLETAYDTAGRPFKFTSFDSTAGGTIRNQVEREFNGLSQLTAEYQAHNGGVNKPTSPKVGYTYSEDGGANHSRMIGLVYPASFAYANGRTLNYNYTGQDATISRLTSLSNGVTLEQYTYLGLGSVVERAHPQPGVNLTYLQATPGGASSDFYVGLDRFDRIVDQRWHGPVTDNDRFKYGYDRNSNRLYRENAAPGGSAFSELYHSGGVNGEYDKLNQLTAFKRGTLNAGKDDVPNPTRTQSWLHDAQGNWGTFTTNQDPAQSRDHNKQNQITSITGKTPPVYDANGNMKADENGRTLVYDAWNRLVTANGVGYEHDAFGRRIEEQNGATKDLFYSANWQVLEEQEAGKLKAEYVWSPAYVDALVLRNRDTGTDGVIDETLYVQQDANWNVTALVGFVNGNWKVVERFVYDPYGAVTILDANSWTTKSISDYDWRYLHQGGRFDTATGLYHFRNRDYSPSLGRWAQRDPIEFAGGDTNLYGYVHNGPTGATDPSGLQDLRADFGPPKTLAPQVTQSFAARFVSSMNQFFRPFNFGEEARRARMLNQRTAELRAQGVPISGQQAAGLSAQAALLAAREGGIDALAIGANVVTFRQITALDEHVQALIRANPSYAISDVSFTIARELLLMAATGGISRVLQSPGLFSRTTVTGARLAQPVILAHQVNMTVQSALATWQAWEEGDVGGLLLNGFFTVLGGFGTYASAANTARILRRTDSLHEANAMMGRNLPQGMSRSQFGDVMQWGGGHASARARMGTLTAQELRAAGVTAEMADGWAAAYAAIARIAPSNPSAAGRADLMRHAARLLRGQ